MISKVTVCSEYSVMPQITRNAYQQVSQFKRGRIIAFESVDYHSVISPAIQVDIHPLSSEYGINVLLRVILMNGMQNLDPFRDQPPKGQTYCEVSTTKPYNHITDH